MVAGPGVQTGGELVVAHRMHGSQGAGSMRVPQGPLVVDCQGL